uniref:Uncharacterized protein n=1 Tax=Anguilla anguilla TaxID=7936 RepID=A0A0E9RJA3_ANGAN
MLGITESLTGVQPQLVSSMRILKIYKMLCH